MYYYDLITDRVMIWKPPVKFEGYVTVSCKRRRCTTCNYINSRNYTYSYITRKKYFTNLGARQGNCLTTGIVYGISCRKCDGCVYVGMTTRALSTRFMEHRNSVNSQKNTHLPLYNHFSTDNHTSEDMQIQIIYKTDKLSKDEITEDLLSQELLWTKILNTAYPFGCNDSIRGYGNVTEEHNFEGKRNHPYLTYPCPRKPRSHGRRRRSKRNAQIHADATDAAIATLKNTNIHIREFYLNLRTMSKITLKKLLTYAMTHKDTIEHNRLLTLYFVVASMISSKSGQANPPKPYRWCVLFPNKGMEYIRLETILKDRRLQKELPAIPTKVISITFTYSKPCKLTVCNYNSVLRELNKEILLTTLNKPCDCTTNKYTYQPLQHVLTGDLNIIEDQNLRNIFANGSKYRPATAINWKDNDIAFEEALKNLLKWLSKDTRHPIERFNAYRDRFRYLYQSRKEHSIRMNESVDYDVVDKNALKKLHDKYVVTVVDKAPNNLVIMCKKLFLITLCRELGIDYQDWTIAGNEVYKPSTEDVKTIMRPLLTYARKYNIDVQDSPSLASIYPIPKLHKNPYKFRFIASSRTSAMKPISNLLDSILGHIKIHFRNICKKICQRTGINPWWSIDSTYDFTDICHRLQNKKLGTKYIFTGDFSDMFTSCEHNTLRTNLCNVINICYRNSGFTYIKVHNGKVTYTNEETDTRSFRKEDLYEMIDFILDNNYVTFAGHIFKQIKGVPMGLPSAPKMIDLTMAYCEYKYMSNSSNQITARNIGNYTCRYVDDFFSCTESDIENILKDIYPRELTLNKTSNTTSTTFLDVSIQLRNDKLIMSVYNKTDDFPFTVIKYNHPKSNIHSSVGYNTLYGEILRFARISNTIENFTKRCRLLYHDFLSLGYEEYRITATIVKFFERNPSLMVKFSILDHIAKIMFLRTLKD